MLQDINNAIYDRPNVESILEQKFQIGPVSFIEYSNLIEEAHKAREEKKFDQAIQSYNDAIKVLPDVPVAYIGRGEAKEAKAAELKDNDLQSVLDDYTKALEILPENPQVLEKRAKVYGKLKNTAQAIADLNKRKEALEEEAKFRFQHQQTLRRYIRRQAINKPESAALKKATTAELKKMT